MSADLAARVAALADEWERDEAYACRNASECVRCVSFQRAVIRLRDLLAVPQPEPVAEQATCWRSECRNGCYYPDVCSERPSAAATPDEGEPVIAEMRAALKAHDEDAPQRCGHTSDPMCCPFENLPALAAWFTEAERERVKWAAAPDAQTIEDVLAAHGPFGFTCQCGWMDRTATYASAHRAHVADRLREAIRDGAK